MRSLSLTAVLAVAMLSTTTLAQTAPKAAPAAAGTQPNPLIATVNNDPIRLSDISAWIDTHVQPEQRSQIPQERLFGAALDNLVSGKALQIMARKQGLDKDPAVAKQMSDAANEVLQRALLIKSVRPMVNEDAIKAAYDKQYAGKPGEEEVHARHILVDSEAKATDVINQLKAGAKFEDLAKKYGDPKDPASQQGGDLGFFKKGDMLPEFSDVAFKLKPNEYTKTPVHTRYGWHVIQVLETRVAPPPAYDQVKSEIRQQLLQKYAKEYIAQARAQVKVQLFNASGTPQAAPAPAKAPAAQ